MRYLVILNDMLLLKKSLIHFYNGQGTRDKFPSYFVSFRGHVILKTTRDKSEEAGSHKVTETTFRQEG